MSQSSIREILPIEAANVGGQKVNTVNARDLHEALEVKGKFADWIKYQIDRAQLVADKDFVLLPMNVKQTGSGGHNKVEYHLSTESAKKIAMMSETNKGNEVRDYFLECERKVASPASLGLPDFTDPAAAAMAWAEQYRRSNESAKQVVQLEEVKQQLEAKVEILDEKADGFDRIANAVGNKCITDTAKPLGVSPKALFDWLHRNRWIYRRQGTKNWLAHSEKIRSGELVHRDTTVSQEDGTEKLYSHVLVTPKGLTTLAKLFGNLDRPNSGSPATIGPKRRLVQTSMV